MMALCLIRMGVWLVNNEQQAVPVATDPTLCMCENARRRGVAMLCLQCTGPVGETAASLTEPARKADRLGEGVAWSFNPETRDIECGNAPVFKVYSPDDFPCIEDEDRAKQAEYFDAQAQTVVLMLNSLLHDSGDATPVPDPTHTREAELRSAIVRDLIAERRSYKEDSPTWRAFGFCIDIAEKALSAGSAQ
jgi:hypothetical protein